jgi:hypothetical protein
VAREGGYFFKDNAITGGEERPGHCWLDRSYPTFLGLWVDSGKKHLMTVSTVSDFISISIKM